MLHMHPLIGKSLIFFIYTLEKIRNFFFQQTQLRASKETVEEKNYPQKKYIKRHLAYGRTMTSQLKNTLFVY